MVAYDPLHRLTAADYSSGEFFDYTYDAVGNRLTQQTLLDSNAYNYDAADRLTSVDGVTYTWDAKGNLLSDGTLTYTYDHANRLTQVVQGSNTSVFSYNGLGDRLRQAVKAESTTKPYPQRSASDPDPGLLSPHGGGTFKVLIPLASVQIGPPVLNSLRALAGLQAVDDLVKLQPHTLPQLIRRGAHYPGPGTGLLLLEDTPPAGLLSGQTRPNRWADRWLHG